MISQLLIAVGLILANGFFVSVEFSLLASLPSRIELEAESGSRSAVMALRHMNQVSVVLAGAQFGVTLASLALGRVGEPAMAHLIERIVGVGLSESATRTVGFVLGLSIVVFCHLLIGEMVPKGIALAQPERTLVALALPIAGFVWVFKPIIWLLSTCARLGARLVRVQAASELKNSATAAELQMMMADSRAEGLLDQSQHELLIGALGFLGRTVADVMIPVESVISAPSLATIEDLEALVSASGHSRVVITGVSVDEVIGFVHAKDVLGYGGGSRQRRVPRSMIRPLMQVAPADSLGDIGVAMREERRHVAVVCDHSATVGLVTLEDVIESIVGSIVDETDGA